MRFIIAPNSVPENDPIMLPIESNFLTPIGARGKSRNNNATNSDEQLVLYGNTGVVEEGTTAGSMSLFWTPLRLKLTVR